MPQDLLLLDTDIVSLVGRRRPPPGLRPWLLRVGIQRLAISYPTITELMRGAHLKCKDDPEKAARIMAWVSQILDTRFHMPEMTAEVAVIYAHMTCVPGLRHMWTVQRHEKSNRLGHDLMLAAVSIVHRIPIITCNIADFERIDYHFPLPGVFQPMQARWHVRPVSEVLLPPFEAAEEEPDETALPTL